MKWWQRPLFGSIVASGLAGCVLLNSPDPQPFTLYTHRGVEHSLIEFDGDYWQTQEPGPLADGFGDPVDRGTIVRTTAWTAVYTSSQDVRLGLTRLDARPDPIPCY